MTRRTAAEDAVAAVTVRVLRAGVTGAHLWIARDGRLPHITLTLPTAGRDEPTAVALAMDAGVGDYTVRDGLVSGVVVVDDVPAPEPVEVRVQVVYGVPDLAGIPAPRSGDVEVVDEIPAPRDPRDDRDRDDDVYEDARLAYLEHGVEQ